MQAHTDATVLIVDDEADLAELYASWLDGVHQVRTAYDGEAALAAVGETVDVVFLDRQMPAYTGDDVLERIRERELGCRVVMVTAVDPDFDIVAMPFDDYLTKPVTRADLLQAVESMLDRAAYDDAIQEYFALCSKKATLEAEKTPTELAANDEYREMVARAREMRTEVDSAVTGFEDDVEKLFLELPGRQ